MAERITRATAAPSGMRGSVSREKSRKGLRRGRRRCPGRRRGPGGYGNRCAPSPAPGCGRGCCGGTAHSAETGRSRSGADLLAQYWALKGNCRSWTMEPRFTITPDPPLAHARHRLLDQGHRGEVVHLEEAAAVGERRVLDGSKLAHAGVVDEDVHGIRAAPWPRPSPVPARPDRRDPWLPGGTASVRGGGIRNRGGRGRDRARFPPRNTPNGTAGWRRPGRCRSWLP